jgi:transcriptional regulator with XRE-family HTH domain
MIGNDLRLIRIEAGLTQVQLAEKLNITQGMISRIERGDTTSTDVVERWANICNGIVRIEGSSGRTPEMQKLLQVLPELSSDDMRRLITIARGLPGANHTFKDGIVAVFAGLIPPGTGEPDMFRPRRSEEA